MQRTKISARLTSFVLTLAILLSVFSVFAFAQDSADDGVSASELSVAYNRTFSEGWDYTNGIVDTLAKGNTAGLAYEYRNSLYNYYLRLDKQNTTPAYLYISTEGRLATSGKTFIEFDITSGAGAALGQAVRVSVRNDIKTLVEFRDEGMLVLGENVGTSVYDLKWESLKFVFDFDYVSEQTLDTCYRVSAYHNGDLVAEEVWEYGKNGAGISQIRFAFGDVREQSVGSWYGVDNIKAYSGVDDFTTLESDDYGLAVDTLLEKDFPLVGDAADPDGYLRGEPDVERLDSLGTAIVHYNRDFDEGWTLANGATVADGGNNVDIRSEKTLTGAYNYFFRYRALTTALGHMSIPVKNYPTDDPLYLEFDIKAGVNVDLGDILRVSSSSSAEEIAAIKNGQLCLFDEPVGYIGSDWLHVIMIFSNELNDNGKYTCTVYFANNGSRQYEFGVGAISDIRFGAIGGTDERYGDWFGVDNIRIYSGTNDFVTIPDDEYGLGVDSSAAKDFEIESATTPETPIDPGVGDADGDGDYTVDYDSERILTGAPDLERIYVSESNPENLWIRYNRHYGEGWGFAVGGGRSSSAIMDLEAEQQLDLSYNYYQYYEQTTSANAYWSLNTGSGSPGSGSFFFELDIRAVEGCNVGGIIQMRTVADGSNPYILEFVNGYLVTNISGKSVKLGRVTEDEWVHVAFQFDYDYAIKNPAIADPGQYLARMWVGDQTYFEAVRSTSGEFGISQFRIGFEGSGALNNGQFWHMDNLQVYGGTHFADLHPELYGSAINATEEKDFPIQTDSVSLDTMTEESLFMKVGSEYGLVNNERTPNLTDDANGGKAYGCPTRIGDDVWVPLDTILNFLSYPIYIHEDGMSFDISTGSAITYITLGRNTAVVGGTQISLTAAPAMVTDKLGYEFLAVTIDDLALLFPEFYIGCDDMNMVVFSEYETIASGSITQSIRMDIMRDFLFDYATADEIYERAAEHTNNFDHPYLIANQDRFDELHEVWVAGRASLDNDPSNDVEYDPILYRYINSIVSRAVRYYNQYSALVQDMTLDDGLLYDGLNPLCYVYDSEASGSIGLMHPYKTSAGYDPIGGRLNPPFDPLEPVAYAYQVTRDIRFAQFAYDFAEALADWDHWGPGHFLNAADTAASMAICYDWCYDAWVELGLDVDKIADALFYHGTLQGYFISTGDPDPHGRAGGSGSNYTTMINNWNPVCTSGMTAASFAVMNYTGYSPDTKLQQSKAALRAEVYGGEMVRVIGSELISMNFKTVIAKALDMYAPDGSYEESVSYWAYGANNLFRYASILESVLGDDLGIMDTWGIDRTCYSITHMVSSDYRVFAYNDGSVGGACSSGWFNYVAQSVGDDFLRLIRNMHINEGGLAIGMFDSLFYKEVDLTQEIEMPLEYHHIGIHGYTVRSSWERGAVFAGLLGGDNNDGHGHIDAGQWIYYSHGIPFIEDIGPDGYNTYKYFSNNHMYKTTTEGHNVMLVSSDQVNLPAGQLRDSVSPVVKTGANEYGAYCVVDTKPAFGSTLLTSERGMLFTNDRKTVIIQDEIIPNGSQTVWWIAHYSTEQIVNVEIANNGRTVYMTSVKSSVTGGPVVLRMNMVSPTPGIMFEKSTSYDYLLDATMRPGDSEAMGKQPEGDRSNWLKLLVKFENLMSIDFAVALEVIDPADPVLTGYRFTVMDEWEPYADARVSNDDDKEDEEIIESVTQRGSAKASDVLGFASRLDSLVSQGTHFEQLSDFYSAITQMTYTVNSLGRDRFENDTFAESLYLYDTFYMLYFTYYDDAKLTTDSIGAITDLLVGAKPKAEAS